MKRILVLADLHCGHLVGLTAPHWQTDSPDSDGRTKRGKFAPIQREAWDWYVKNVTAGGPYDLVVVNGDAIDGRGDRSGGNEQITTDRQEQVDMACVAIRKALIGKPKLVMTYGTGYHTGNEEDWENDIAKELQAEKIGSHEWVESSGVVFDFKHFISGSQTPMGRTAALERAAIWNMLWADQEYTPRADVLVRSHVHYCKYAGDATTQPYLRLTTPALQAMGTRFGSRKCEGLVTFGFVIFETNRGEITRFEPVTAKLKSQVANVLTI
jgi:hypothetical protein